MKLSIPIQFENAQEAARVASVGAPPAACVANDGGVQPTVGPVGRQDP